MNEILNDFESTSKTIKIYDILRKSSLRSYLIYLSIVVVSFYLKSIHFRETLTIGFIIFSIIIGIIPAFIFSIFYEYYSVKKVLIDRMNIFKFIKYFYFGSNYNYLLSDYYEKDKQYFLYCLRERKINQAQKIYEIIIRKEKQVEKNNFAIFDRFTVILFIISLFSFLGNEILILEVRLLIFVLVLYILVIPYAIRILFIIPSLRGIKVPKKNDQFVIDVLFDIYLETKSD